MIAFTIFGVLCYWILMGLLGFGFGYALRMYVDMRQGIRRLCDIDRQVDTAVAEIAAVVTWMTAYGAATSEERA